MCKIALLTTLLALAGAAWPGTAQAGPPLVCHPFPTGNSASLPWKSGSGWYTPDPSYDVRRVPEDTLRLLAAEKAVVPRMELLRRAAIYAMGDERVASELLVAVLSRALTAEAENRSDALALFDAGYLIETLKQTAAIRSMGMGRRAIISPAMARRIASLDRYELTRRALELAHGNADIEFAASLMTQGAEARQHRSRAEAEARKGSLLDSALASFRP